MQTLICKQVEFYSPNDETAFFEWLKKIRCIQEVAGISDEIHLKIPSKQVSDKCLRDLIAVFKRYQIDMKQLAQFLDDSNKTWFQANTKTFWYKKVFGKERNDY